MLIRNIKSFFTVIIFCTCLLLSNPASAGFKEGKEAYTKKDWAMAIFELRPIAEQEHAEAQLLLANMYSDGMGVKKSIPMAYSLYKRSAENGNDNAMLALATIYVSGVGVPKNMDKGVAWFTKAAERGNQAAQFTLGSIFVQGIEADNIPADIVASYKWYRIASQKEDIKRIKHASAELVKVLTEKLTPEEIAKAEEEIANWRPITNTPQDSDK